MTASEPPFDGVDLPIDRTGDPAAVAAGLGGVNGRDQGDVEVLGQRDRRVRDEPIVCVDDLGLPTLAQSGLAQRNSCPHNGVAHGERPGEHVLAEHEVRGILGDRDDENTVLDAMERRMGRSVGSGGTARENHDLVAASHELGGEVMHMATEAAHHHRRVFPRHHQNLHLSFPSLRPIPTQSPGVEGREQPVCPIPLRCEFGGANVMPPCRRVGDLAQSVRVDVRAPTGVLGGGILADHECPVAGDSQKCLTQNLIVDRVA